MSAAPGELHQRAAASVAQIAAASWRAPAGAATVRITKLIVPVERLDRPAFLHRVTALVGS